MGERVDLDAIETRLATRYGEVVTIKADDVLAMAAELRVAREVIKQARPYVGHPPEEGRSYPPLAVAIDAYDRAAALQQQRGLEGASG